jgi:uncharacterized protein
VTDATSPAPISLGDPIAVEMAANCPMSRDPVADDASSDDVTSDVAPGHLTVSGPVMPHTPNGAVPALTPGLPPRTPRVPIECGDLPFLIQRDGTWLYQGTPILRKELVCLFASVLRRDIDGAWWLRTPAERGRIEVEDAPFIAVELDWGGDGRQQILSFRTNTDQVVTAGPEHPIRVSHDLLTCEPTPYIRLRNGDGDHPIEARVNRAVYYELVALAVPEYVGSRLMLGVWSSGVFFPLGFMPEEDSEDEL